MMQYYSPVNGLPNARTNYPYIPTGPPIPYPRTVGEGDVVSVALPDGSLQLYFVPCRAPYYGNSQPWNTQTEAWFIRTIPNLFPAPQPPALNHQVDNQLSSFNLYQNNAFKTEDKPGFPLQFHNDQTTSSTDMHYFCRQQVEQPVKLYEMVCGHCSQYRGQEPMQADYSGMSIDGPIEEKRTLSYGDAKRNKIRFNVDNKHVQNACKSNCKCMLLRTSKSIQSAAEQGCQCGDMRTCQSTGEQACLWTSERASQSVSERGVQPASETGSQSMSETANQATNPTALCNEIINRRERLEDPGE